MIARIVASVVGIMLSIYVIEDISFIKFLSFHLSLFYSMLLLLGGLYFASLFCNFRCSFTY